MVDYTQFASSSHKYFLLLSSLLAVVSAIVKEEQVGLFFHMIFQKTWLCVNALHQWNSQQHTAEGKIAWYYCGARKPG